MKLLYDFTAPLLAICPRKMETAYQKMCAGMCVAASLTIAGNWKQSLCVHQRKMDERWYSHTTEWIETTTRMIIKNMMLNERILTQKCDYCLSPST